MQIRKPEICVSEANSKISLLEDAAPWARGNLWIPDRRAAAAALVRNDVEAIAVHAPLPLCHPCAGRDPVNADPCLEPKRRGVTSLGSPLRSARMTEGVARNPVFGRGFAMSAN